MNDNERRNLAARLHDLANRLTRIDPPNDRDHTYTRTGLLLLRSGLACIDNGDRAHRLAVDWSARGYPTNTNGDAVRSSTDTTSVERASETTDHWERQAAMLEHERAILDTNAFAIEHRIANTVGILERQGRTSTLIDCANRNCDATMTGLGEDRPRDGRCERCYRFKKRTGRDWTSRQEPCPHHETAGT